MKQYLSLGFIFLFFSMNLSIGQHEITNCFLFENATVVTKPGIELKNTSVLIRNGLIVAIGDSIDQPFDAKVYDCTGSYIYHAFIDGFSQIAVSKTTDEKATRPAVASNVTLKQAGVRESLQ